jgi:HlyD family secretion protein
MILSRRGVGFALLGIVGLLLASGAYLRIRGAGETGSDGATEAERPDVSATSAFPTALAIPVEGGLTVRDTLVIAVEAAGQAAARRRAGLLALVPGQVVAVAVRENHEARSGELLLQLDTTEFALAVAEADARRGAAEGRFWEQVMFDDRITDSSVRAERERAARARSGLNEAEVALARAQLELTRTRVRAPFPGRVASVKVVPGQWVRTGDSLLTVVDLDPIKVDVQVLESEVGYLAPGRGASIRFAAFPDEIITGRIETVNPIVDQVTRTARVTVAVSNPRGRILPGMYARVSLEARRFANRVLVPRSAILERDRRTMLFVYEGDEREGLAKWRYVTTGLENDSLVEIVPHPDTDMVEPGEVVLTDGHHTLIHDARVRLVEHVRAAGGRPD